MVDAEVSPFAEEESQPEEAASPRTSGWRSPVASLGAALALCILTVELGSLVFGGWKFGTTRFSAPA